jgi:hypothetical protein
MAKLLSIPVLAVSGFVVAATLAGVGLAGVTTSSTTTTTTPPTTTTTTTPPTTTTTTTVPRGEEGCTPGFWKNHLGAWPMTYDPDQLVGSVFGAAPDEVAELTLLEGLQTGGGGVFALTRQAIAALLAAASPEEVDYPLTEAEIIGLVNAAFTSGDVESLKDMLDAFNNAGAPGFCD